MIYGWINHCIHVYLSHILISQISPLGWIKSTSIYLANWLSSSFISAEEDRSREETGGEEGAVEGEKGGKAAEKGGWGDGGRRGERPAGGGCPGKWLPSSRPAGAGENDREAAEEDLLQEAQNGEWVWPHWLF